ncbi:hypothetical protein ACRE_016130 [Hapsidospora chrysogenum ATCC 11550]|uniref:Aminoglycoside phosphotransferase domain-containing protein n=1 Tax=Hapsidospora chrysogenum (strain ATCC 11550 / CBS 779.69 / DSM 880 / IAM 14645 / JCM 23072 / IMI 49137) TaxID=857340 RepID=A0A086TDV5_HAPC1|nr:hypothetical protein ACRE_016130 [Hapsidospora chrysogenum ATCC 11550]
MARYFLQAAGPPASPPPASRSPQTQYPRPVATNSRDDQRSQPQQRSRFRTRSISASGSPVDPVHANVLRLDIQPSAVQRFFQSLLEYLPSATRAWLGSVFPEWNLPSRFILKKRKDGWEEEFEGEKATYARLRPLQGIVIPEFLGEVDYENTPALLLSDIGGECLATPQGALLEVADLRRMLFQAPTALSQFGILQCDEKLDNFHHVEDKIMIVDLEMVTQGHVSEEDLKLDAEGAVDDLARDYEDGQYCLWKDGLISVDIDK